MRVLAAGTRGRRLVTFSMTVLLTGVVSILTIPVIIGTVGAAAWASLSIGQSVGTSVALVVAFGWGLTGPAMTALKPEAERPIYYVESLISRVWIVVPGLIAAVLITIAIAPEEWLASCIAGCAAVLGGLSANWYFIGLGSPGKLLLLDTVPKVSGTLLGTAALVLTGNIVLFALGQFVGMLAAVVVSSVVVLRATPRIRPSAYPLRRVLTILAGQRHGVMAIVAMSAFVPIVLAVVSVEAPAALPIYALADRILRFAALAASPVIQLFQGWVPRVERSVTWRRIRTAGAVSVALAAVGGAALPVVLIVSAQLLTHSSVRVPTTVAIVFGLIFFGQVFGQFLSSVALVAVGREASVARANVITLLVAIPVLVVTALLLGGIACVWVWLVAEMALVAQQLASLAQERRRDASAAAVVEPMPIGER